MLFLRHRCPQGIDPQHWESGDHLFGLTKRGDKRGERTWWPLNPGVGLISHSKPSCSGWPVGAPDAMSACDGVCSDDETLCIAEENTVGVCLCGLDSGMSSELMHFKNTAVQLCPSKHMK